MSGLAQGGWWWNPLDWILPSIAGLSVPDLAVWSCTADFSSVALSSPIQAATCYPGKGDYFPLLGSQSYEKKDG